MYLNYENFYYYIDVNKRKVNIVLNFETECFYF